MLLKHRVVPPDFARVLVLFGNIPLYGRERADIQLFTSMKEAKAALRKALVRIADQSGEARINMSRAAKISLAPLGFTSEAFVHR